VEAAATQSQPTTRNCPLEAVVQYIQRSLALPQPLLAKDSLRGGLSLSHDVIMFFHAPAYHSNIPTYCQEVNGGACAKGCRFEQPNIATRVD
jgi:hypothetical protein